MRTSFINQIRPLFGSFTQSQVDGLNALLDVWDEYYSDHDLAFCAYCLATSYHETARRMRPVRETLASSEAIAIRRLNIAYRKGQLKYVRAPYWRRDATGRAWFGRGHVQLTHRRNYVKAARCLNVPVDETPELCLSPRSVGTHLIFWLH